MVDPVTNQSAPCDAGFVYSMARENSIVSEVRSVHKSNESSLKRLKVLSTAREDDRGVHMTSENCIFRDRYTVRPSKSALFKK